MKSNHTLSPQTTLSLRDKTIASLVIGGFCTAVFSLMVLLQMQHKAENLTAPRPGDTVIEQQTFMPIVPGEDSNAIRQPVRP